MSISLSHLPKSPSSNYYRSRVLHGDDYTSTGWFESNETPIKKENCLGAGCIFIDFDLVDYLEISKDELFLLDDDTLDEHLLDLFDIARNQIGHNPTTVVSSGYGLHFYFWLDRKTYRLAEIQQVNKRLVRSLVLADQQVTNTGERLSRPPGSFNTKAGKVRKPRAVELIFEEPSNLYTLDELDPKSKSKSFRGISEIKEARADIDWSMVDMPELGGTLDEISRGLTSSDKIKCKCPFHEGKSKESAFLKLDSTGRPFLRCESEKVTYRPMVWTPEPVPSEVIVELEVHPKSGKPFSNFANLQTILRMDERIRNRYWWDSRLRELKEENGSSIEDRDLISLKGWIVNQYGIEYSVGILLEAVQLEADKNERNPLIEYLDDCAENTEDRENLFDDWLIVAFGAEDSELHRAYCRKFLISAVARAYNPGCRVDTVLTLVGAQGVGKSSGFQLLAPDGHFSDSHLDLQSKDSYAQLARSWIYEISELASFTKREHELVKAWISSREDVYREPYGRLPIRRPRQSVLVATTNDATPLSDATGSRRFWLVDVDTLDRDFLSKHKRILWGAAVRAYKSGAIWWLDKEEETLRIKASREYQRENPLVSAISKLVRLHQLDSSEYPGVFSINDVFDKLGIKPEDRRRHLRSVNDALIEMGAARLKRSRKLPGGGNIIHWIAPGEKLSLGLDYRSEEERKRHLSSKLFDLHLNSSLNSNTLTKQRN